MTPPAAPSAKVKVTVKLPRELVQAAKIHAIQSSGAGPARVHLQDLIERGLRAELRGAS